MYIQNNTLSFTDFILCHCITFQIQVQRYGDIVKSIFTKVINMILAP